MRRVEQRGPAPLGHFLLTLTLAVGCDSEPAVEVPLGLLDEATFFTGSMSFGCGAVPSPSPDGSYRFRAQAELTRKGGIVEGRLWLPAVDHFRVGELTGVVGATGVDFAPTSLSRSLEDQGEFVYEHINGLTLLGLHDEGGALVATGTGRYQAQGYPEVEVECNAASAAIRLEVDRAPPTSQLRRLRPSPRLREEPLLAGDPVGLFFDELVIRSKLEVTARSGAAPIEVTLTTTTKVTAEHIADFADRVVEVAVTPKTSWPAGVVEIVVRGAEDLVGQRALDAVHTIEIPSSPPVTVDPSFELEASGAWFGCARSEAEENAAGGWRLDPSDGSWMAVCSEERLRGHFEVPAGANKVSIDAAAFNPENPTTLSAADMRIELLCDGATTTLGTSAPDRAIPQFDTYTAAVQAGTSCWLTATHDARVSIHEAGIVFFLDHLRFE